MGSGSVGARAADCTCGAAVPLHPQLVARLGVSHAELVVDGVGCLPLVPQVHPELVLPLGRDFVQVVQPWGRQARVDAEAQGTIVSTPLCQRRGWCALGRAEAHRPGPAAGCAAAGATPGRADPVSEPQVPSGWQLCPANLLGYSAGQRRQGGDSPF